MKRLLRVSTVVLLALSVPCLGTEGGATQLEGIGTVGGGLFMPTGADGDIAGTSPTIQLAAAVAFAPHLGVEAEFLYVPILLKSDVLVTSSYKRSSQMTALGGLRIASGHLIGTRAPAVGYCGLRVGFSRVATRSSLHTNPPVGSWIGRSAADAGSWGTTTESSFTAKRRALVLSPKAGMFLHLTERSAIDIAFFPVFIFDREEVTSQLFLTVGFALSAWQTF
jgi:hypothetical protein